MEKPLAEEQERQSWSEISLTVRDHPSISQNSVLIAETAYVRPGSGVS
jgi:uncharacterized protein YaeQ